MIYKNLPNALTILRIILVPVYLIVFFSPLDNHIILALAVFLLAGLTDIADGRIARKYGLITRLGIVLDPLADKLMLLSVLFSLTLAKIIPYYISLIVLIKESIMVVGAAFLLKKKNITISADKYGKLATVIFYIAVTAVILKIPYAMVILIIAIIATILALINYALKFKEIKKE